MNPVSFCSVAIQGAQGTSSPMAGHTTRVTGKVPSSSAGPSFQEVLDRPRAVNAAGLPVESAAAARSSVSPVFGEVIESLGRSEMRIDRLIRRGMRGRSFTQSELLSMQALVYRYGQRLEVATKLAEAVASGARQMLSIQV
ncbi:MAG: hypothetical protein JW797_12780 [Bradymonadales bacterium]|nr:hypothetical protein [Bradymonadales bacterium]